MLTSWQVFSGAVWPMVSHTKLEASVRRFFSCVFFITTEFFYYGPPRSAKPASISFVTFANMFRLWFTQSSPSATCQLCIKPQMRELSSFEYDTVVSTSKSIFFFNPIKSFSATNTFLHSLFSIDCGITSNPLLCVWLLAVPPYGPSEEHFLADKVLKMTSCMTNERARTPTGPAEGFRYRLPLLSLRSLAPLN